MICAFRTSPGRVLPRHRILRRVFRYSLIRVKKVDLVALPDFLIGAMENMDCITFRGGRLLIDPNNATRSSLVRAAEIVMHFSAHMWFGNLVTMDWWNGLWLKESFATFMANLALDRWQPDWNVWTSFATTRMAAMSLDSQTARNQ
ncbi:MAG: M1 family aminopeptidase [Cyanobacteriota/Melainabacteria group bacterium]